MTVKELAEIAGVSPAAVSRYANGGSLSEEKRKAIQDAMKKTGFRPTAAGNLLKSGKSNMIGVIVPKINSESVSQVTSGIAKAVEDTDYLIMLGACDSQAYTELSYLKAMQENNVAGIILMGTCYTPALKSALEECEVPVVVTGQNFEGVNCVYHDDFNAAKSLTQAMLAKGRRKIAYIGVDERDPAAGYERRHGVQAALKEVGITDFPSVVGDFTAESGSNLMEQLMNSGEVIDGVICATDMIALGAMNFLKQHNISVPEDIAIAGIGNCWASTFVEPKMTSVRLYYHQCGVDAAEMLLHMLKSDNYKDEPIRQMMLGYTVIERESI